MVNYTYQNLFYKSHQAKDILIVDNEATVTPVTGQPPSVTGATVEIHTGDLDSESFELDESLCSEDNIKFGLCESASVRFTIENKASIPNLKSTSYSKVLNVYLYFNGNSDTLFQIGTYICEKDEYSINRKQREVELYDALHYLYDFDVTTFYNNVFKTSPVATIKGIRDGLFTYLATEFDYPIEQTTVTLVNDNTLVNKNIKSDTITFGFLMEQMLEVCGVFGHINRMGQFDYISLAKYDEESVATVTDDYRKPPTQYKDYIVWYVEKVRVYDQNNLKRCTVGSSSHKVPNIYKVIDNFVCESYSTSDTDVALLKLVAENMHSNIIYVRYKPCEIDCVGNPCIEVGDKIDVEYDKDGDGNTETFYTIVLERHLRGLGTMLDNYIARGDKKQPKYKPNQNWHDTDGAETETTSGEGVNGVAEVKDETLNQFVQIIRNIGFRLLPEPSDVSVEYTNGQVEIKWSDPDDITNYKPVPCEWAGTVLVRKEGSSPLHRFGGDFGGTVLVDNTVRDTYKTNAYVDNTVEPNKKYYYGIFPYHVALDDADHPIKHYRFTKVFSVNTDMFIEAPEITLLSAVNTTAILNYSIPTLDTGTYTVRKLVGKKNSIPKSKTDGSVIEDLTANVGSHHEVRNLDADSTYYFAIFTEDDLGNKASSEPKSVNINPIRFVLINSYTNYHNPMVDLSNTGFKDGNQTTRWQYLQDGTFESYDNTQAQTKCVFSAKMKKGTATKLCIECTTENIAAYPDFGFGLLSSMPTAWGYPSGGNKGTVLKWLYDFASTTKGTYELSLDDISADAEFYLCFYNNSTENIVYKVWFEGIPEYTQYDEWWLQPSGDTQVPIKLYGTDTPLVLTINEIMTDLQAAGYNSVLFYPENTGNYIMCAFSIANPTDSLYLSGKSVSIYDENTTYITSWSASGAPDSQNPKHFENCYRYYISGGVRRLDRAGVTHNASALFNADPYVATDTANKEGGYPRIYYTSVQINHLYVDGKEIYQG